MHLNLRVVGRVYGDRQLDFEYRFVWNMSPYMTYLSHATLCVDQKIRPDKRYVFKQREQQQYASLTTDFAVAKA